MGMVESILKKPKRFEIFLINLDPTIGTEIQKTRPCIILSPDEMNFHLSTVIIAPMTTKKRKYPTRIGVVFEGKEGQIALDQMRTVDQTRLIKKLGKINKKETRQLIDTLLEMFKD